MPWDSKNSLDVLSEYLEYSRSTQEGNSEWVNLATPVSFAMARMSPKYRKRFWQVMVMQRKQMGDKVFEDDSDYTQSLLDDTPN